MRLRIHHVFSHWWMQQKDALSHAMDYETLCGSIQPKK